MTQHEAAVLDLSRAAFAAQLFDGLDHEKDAAHPRMVGRQAAAVRVDRQRTPQADATVLHVRAALALLAESQALQGDADRDGERVVDHRHVEVGVGDAGAGHGLGPGLDRGRVGQVAHPGAGMRARLGRAQDIDRFLRQVTCAFRGRDDQRAAAVRDHAAVQQVQRRRHHARGQHVVHGDRIAELGGRIERGMAARGHRDLGQLLAGGAELVHVPLRGQCVVADRGRAVARLELFGRVAAARPAGPDREAVRRPLAAVQDERHVAVARGNRGRGVGRMRHERRAADRVGIEEVRMQIQVFGQRDDAHAADARREQAVHVIEAQPGVIQRPACAFGHELVLGLVRRPA